MLYNRILSVALMYNIKLRYYIFNVGAFEHHNICIEILQLF
jgi:hypothetical protein